MKNILLKMWRGESKLSHVFWLYCVSIGVVVYILSFFLMNFLIHLFNGVNGELNGIVIIFFLLHRTIVFLHNASAMVMLWRCSNNVEWIGWTKLARVLVVSYAVVLCCTPLVYLLIIFI